MGQLRVSWHIARLLHIDSHHLCLQGASDLHGYEGLDELFEQKTLPEGLVQEPGAGHGSWVALRGVYLCGRFYSQEFEDFLAGFFCTKLEIILEQKKEALWR